MFVSAVIEDDGGGKTGDYLLMGDNVATPVHTDATDKVSGKQGNVMGRVGEGKRVHVCVRFFVLFCPPPIQLSGDE